jgi:translocator protein
MRRVSGGRARPIIAAAISASAVAVLGALSTRIGTWYYHLNKPSWQPPDWLFGPAWSVIFALAAIAGLTYWRREASTTARRSIIAAFALNGLLNVFWSLLFFRAERPDWAFAEVGFLWLSIALLIALLARSSHLAALLMLPYLAWVSFAAFLNWKIVQLNAPFSISG